MAWSADPLTSAPRSEVSTLIQSRRKPIAFLMLIALLVAQLAAGLHVLKHLGTSVETVGLPGQHLPLCLECASFAPLAGMHGPIAAGLVIALPAADGVRPLADPGSPTLSRQLPFRSRAPPR
jgi:hypothetical protein